MPASKSRPKAPPALPFEPPCVGLSLGTRIALLHHGSPCGVRALILRQSAARGLSSLPFRSNIDRDVHGGEQRRVSDHREG